MHSARLSAPRVFYLLGSVCVCVRCAKRLVFTRHLLESPPLTLDEVWDLRRSNLKIEFRLASIWKIDDSSYVFIQRITAIRSNHGWYLLSDDYANVIDSLIGLHPILIWWRFMALSFRSSWWSTRAPDVLTIIHPWCCWPWICECISTWSGGHWSGNENWRFWFTMQFTEIQLGLMKDFPLKLFPSIVCTVNQRNAFVLALMSIRAILITNNDRPRPSVLRDEKTYTKNSAVKFIVHQIALSNIITAGNRQSASRQQCHLLACGNICKEKPKKQKIKIDAFCMCLDTRDARVCLQWSHMWVSVCLWTRHKKNS